GEAGRIAKGTEEGKSARGTTGAWSAGASLHRLELLLLVFSEQGLEPRVDLLLDLPQASPLRVGELQRFLLCRREDLAGPLGIAGAGSARRGPRWRGEDRPDLRLLGLGQQPVEPAVNRLLEGEYVLLLAVCQLQAILLGAGHDLAGLRRAIEPVAALAPRPFPGLLPLIGREELLQVRVDVLLDLVDLLPLVGGDLQQFPRDGGQDPPRPRRRPDRRVILDRIDVLPDDRLVGGHLEDGAVGARADERVAVGQPLCPGDEG